MHYTLVSYMLYKVRAIYNLQQYKQSVKSNIFI